MSKYKIVEAIQEYKNHSVCTNYKKKSTPVH